MNGQSPASAGGVVELTKHGGKQSTRTYYYVQLVIRARAALNWARRGNGVQLAADDDGCCPARPRWSRHESGCFSGFHLLMEKVYINLSPMEVGLHTPNL